jgi:hypothetical protein
VSVVLATIVRLLGVEDEIQFVPQTLEPRSVSERCPSSFMWQKTPYNVDCPGGDGTEVYPGVDYLVAYWMGRYYDLIAPGNPHPILWPEGS